MAASPGLGAVTPPEKLALTRLLSALSLANNLRPGAYEQWANTASYYAFADAIAALIQEEGASHRRSARENTALLVATVVVVTYWMDVYPGRSVPVKNVEYYFGCAGIDEKLVVSPLAIACAEDPLSPLTAQQKIWVKNSRTLKELQQILERLDPTPHDPNSQYVTIRTAVITRAHVGMVLKPLVKQLIEQLIAEGHKPFDLHYHHQVRTALKG